MGWLEGGYQTLIDALEAQIRELGGEIHAGHGRRGDRRLPGRAQGLLVEGHFRPFDFVLCTLAPPMARSLLSPDLAAARAARPLPLPRRRLPAAADAAEHQPVLPPEHHRPPGPADDGRRDDARRRSGARRRPPALRLEVRRSLARRSTSGRSKRSSATSSGYAKTIFPDLRDEEILALGRPARAGHRAGAPVGGAKNLPDMFSVAGPRAGLDGARLPGDRQRPGRDGRRASASCRGSSSGFPERESSGAEAA